MPWLIRLDGKQHADWQQFLGRFHPLAVHIPIGLLVLVPVLEIAGKTRPALRDAAELVLALSFIGCLGALTLGYLLAYGSGDAGVGVTRHMWGGIALTISVLVCVLARPWWAAGSEPRAYPALLTCTLLVLLWTAHQGGSLAYGSNYLTAYMPAPMKQVLLVDMVKRNASANGSFYDAHIDPIFDANCVSCHGPRKSSGGLRLDSYAQLMRGGKNGPVIVSGKPEASLLLTRVTLPPGHKGFMPAEGKPPLKPQEIAWIKAWVQQGASPSATNLAGITIDMPRDLPLQPVGDYSALMPQIRQMQQGLGAKLLPVSQKPSDGLVLYTVDVAGNFGDAQLAQLVKFAPYIVEVELGRTAVTDASFATLAKFTHLRAIHLEGTAVTGNGLAQLTGLSQLTYLNLSGTKVTQASVAPLKAMKNLRYVYLYNTPAQPAPAAQPALTVARNTP
jgi:mono/diheme cytochrome c family protein/uncharacterized membrane protein